MKPSHLFLCTIFLLLNVSRATDDDPDLQRRRLLSYQGEPLAVDPRLNIGNPRLRNGYIALQAWKESMLSDPHNITANWIGHDVCNYTGVICWPTPEFPHELTVAGIDLNHGDIAGSLPNELGLLYDLSLIHLNSNRFCGTIPRTFVNMKRLHELDLSNNRFAGTFPRVMLQLPSLRYLDIRFNEFEGELPRKLFELDLDAIFVNNNRFSSALPDNIGKSRVSVIVLANNNFRGCVPAGLGEMGETLNELILINTGLSSCFPSEISKLKNLTVLDLSNNQIVGELPRAIGEMNMLEQLNVAHNMMSGKIADQICEIPNLDNFVYDNNFFSEGSASCPKLPKFADKMNCLKERPNQRSALECQRFLARPVNCDGFKCNHSKTEPPPKVVPCAPPQPPPAQTSLPPPNKPQPAPSPQPPSPPPPKPSSPPPEAQPPALNPTTPMCPCQQPSNPPTNH
ncbi:leucine-rich repeat extensin-like protein 3 [Salvia splendens]|uniref:leucine-rich repeat extensin-like protein 3 n=1 Tax=Salvia splendens TaxID=180675 RepID=UPI001C26F234|nr:leucine-rich repeat extensin-like protein 3 [Salvia splendens]